MDVLFIILPIISVLVCIIACLFFYIRTFKVLSKKGYRYPHIFFWLIPGGMIYVTMGLPLLVLVVISNQLSASDTTGKFVLSLVFSLAFYASLLVSFGLFAFILRCFVPTRPRTGPRKVPSLYYGVSILFYVLSIVSSVVFLVVFHMSIINSLRLVPALWMMAWAFWDLAHRAAAPDLDETQQADTRPPVLYLRAFKDEEHVFARLPRRARDVLSQWYNTQDCRFPNKLYPTFEDFFTDSIRTRLGPFVALGNPQDNLPPLGAVRTYVTDKTWQEEVVRLATNALCILAPVSQSENLKWELDYLRQSGQLKKLFILTPPASSQPLTSPFARLIDCFIRYLTIDNLEKLKGREAMSWEDYRALLGRLGYTLPVTDPGLGSIITFDRTGNAKTLVQGVRTVDEYVEAIALRLSQMHESLPECESVK